MVEDFLTVETEKPDRSGLCFGWENCAIPYSFANDEGKHALRTRYFGVADDV